jgi:type II secretory pathway component PulF
MALELQATIDKEVLEVLSKLYKRESPYTLLETLKEIKKSERKRLEKVEASLNEGQSFAEVLYQEKLISQPLYEFLISAEGLRNIDEFAKEKLKTDKEIQKIVKDMVMSLISPVLAFLISISVIHIFLYKVIPQFNIQEKHLMLLPSYFSILLKLSHNQILFFIILATIFITFALIIAFRKHLPFLRTVFLLYERVKLYIHLYLSRKVGYNIDQALRKYKGTLKPNIDYMLSLMEEGENIVEAFNRSIPDITPLEKPIVIASLKTASVSDLKDLADETMELMKTRLEIFKNTVNTISLLIVSSVILFAYGGIMLPLLKAIKQMNS